MDTYSTLRHLADSWVLLALVGFFAGAVAFAWRPGSRGLQADAGAIPFRHEEGPRAAARQAAAPPSLAATACKGCDGCACGAEAAR